MIKTEVKIKEYDPMLFNDSTSSSAIFTFSRALMDIDKLSTKIVEVSVDSDSEQLRKTILNDIINMHLNSALIFNNSKRLNIICGFNPDESDESYLRFNSETLSPDNRFYLGNDFYNISQFIDPRDFVGLYLGNEIGKEVFEKLKGGQYDRH